MPERSPRRRTWNRIAIALTCAVLLVVAVALLAGAGDGDETDEADVQAVEFERFDGEQGTLADYEGKPVVVNFFASWCRPCIQEMPAIERVHEEYGDRVAFVGFNVNDPLDEGQQVARRTKVTYDLGRDPTGEILDAFGGEIMPTTALVDGDGRIVKLHNGEVSASELEDLVRDELLS